MPNYPSRNYPTRRFICVCGVIAVVLAVTLYTAHIRFQPYLFFMGAAIDCLGVWVTWAQICFLRGTRKTYGTFVGWAEVAGSPNPNAPRRYYYKELTFIAEDGNEYRVRCGTGSSSKSKTPIGSRIPVRYDPADPAGGRVSTLFDYWGPGMILVLFGSVVLWAAFHPKH